MFSYLLYVLNYDPALLHCIHFLALTMLNVFLCYISYLSKSLPVFSLRLSDLWEAQVLLRGCHPFLAGQRVTLHEHSQVHAQWQETFLLFTFSSIYSLVEFSVHLWPRNLNCSEILYPQCLEWICPEDSSMSHKDLQVMLNKELFQYNQISQPYLLPPWQLGAFCFLCSLTTVP